MKYKLFGSRARPLRNPAPAVMAAGLTLAWLLIGSPSANADGMQANVASYFSACTGDVYVASRHIGNESQGLQSMAESKPTERWDSQIRGTDEQLVDSDLIVSIVAPKSQKNDYGLKAAIAAAETNLTVTGNTQGRTSIYEAPTPNAGAGSARRSNFAAVAGLSLLVAMIGCFGVRRILVVRSQSPGRDTSRRRVRRSITGGQRQGFRGGAYQVV